ncbi:MAG: YitT family protein [Erysipelothrix sp.]|nr:YitT family protein [Erysipelothrix sp.]
MTKFIKDNITEFLVLLLGNFLLACAVNFFILPYDILTGGVFGVSIALSPLLPNVDTKYIAYFFIFITYILGAAFLGKKFALKTLASSIAYPLMIELLRYSTFTIEIDPMLASLYGGLLSGVALGLVFRSHASTGGMDVFPLLLDKYFHIPTSKGLMLVDGLTVALGVYTLGITHVLIGLISVWATSYMIDKVLLFGSETTKSIQIISNQLDIINSRIHLELNRGTTIISAVGGYGGEARDIIMCVVTNEQYTDLKTIVMEEDPSAFLIVQDAREILGEGFRLGHRV